jgi:predicted acylesterase/phospholipase RssA
MTTHQDALLMKGGGVKGLAFAGALLELEKFYSFDAFVGVSAGAIAAVLLAAGYSADDLRDELQQVDFTEFIDHSLGARIRNLLSKRGINSGDQIERWIDERLKDRLHLNARTKLGNLPKHAIVYASTLKRDALKFDSKETPELYASKAVRYSISIPYYFTREERDGDPVYDGGLTHNFPDKVFASENPNASYIGLYLAPEASGDRQRVYSEVLSIMMGRDELTRVNENAQRIVWIDPSPIRTVDFHLSQQEKNLLLTAGRVGALRFLQAQNQPVNVPRLETLEDRLRHLRDRVIATRKKRQSRRCLVVVSVLMVPILAWLAVANSDWLVRMLRQPRPIGVASGVSEALGHPEKQDLVRIVLKRNGESLSGKLGREEALRAFMAPAKYFTGEVSVGEAASLLGNQYDADRDVAIIYCRAKNDSRIFDAKLATWMNLAKAIMADIKASDGLPLADCKGLTNEDDRLYCHAKVLLDAVSTTDETWVAGALERLYSAVAEVLADPVALKQLRVRYGVTESFSGLGFTVGGTGGTAEMVEPDEILGRLKVPEYLVKNLALQQAGCKCVRIAPYEERDSDPLDLAWVEKHGSSDCPQKTSLATD